MDLVALLRVAVRRWLITVPVVLAAIGVSVIVEAATDPVHEAGGSLLIAAPTAQDRPSPTEVVDLDELAERVRLGDDARAITAASPATTVTVEATSETVVEVVAEGVDGDTVTAAVEDLAAQVIEEVDLAQEDAGIDESERVTASVTAEDITPVVEEDGDTTVVSAAIGVRLDDPFAARENPLGADLSTARIVQVVGQSDRARDLVASTDPQVTDYSLGIEDFDQAPIVNVSVQANSPEAALDGFDAVVAVVGELADERQAAVGVPSFDRVIIEPLAAPSAAEDVSPPVSAAVVVIVALGIVVALVLAVLADNLAARRARRTAATSTSAPRASETNGSAAAEGTTSADAATTPFSASVPRQDA